VNATCLVCYLPANRTALRTSFDHPVIQRCQLHKIRNVEAKLPKNLAATVTKKMRAAYHDGDPLAAEANLDALARSLDKAHPGAAGSLREGLTETLTVSRLEVPPTLARTLRSTNGIESMIGICRDHSSNVKRWRKRPDGAERCAAGMTKPPSSSDGSTATSHLPALRRALNDHVTATVTPVCQHEEEAA